MIKEKNKKACTAEELEKLVSFLEPNGKGRKYEKQFREAYNCYLFLLEEEKKKVNKETIEKLNAIETNFNTNVYFKRAAKRSKVRSIVEKILSYAMMALLAFFILFPFYVLFVTSIMRPEESHNTSFKFWPDEVVISNYIDVLFKGEGGHSVPKSFLLTLIIYLPTSIIGVIVSAIAAFAFAKMNFKLKKPLFAILMGSMMVPNTMSLIISFLIYDKIGWTIKPFSILPIILPRMFGTVAIVFFLRQYYMNMPRDLIDSAKMDGLGWWKTFWKIIFPLSIPAMTAQVILFFISGYNDYLAPLLYLKPSGIETLQIALASYVDPYYINWPVRMAAAIVAMIPMIVLYLFSQKAIMKDMSVGSGIKG